MSENPIALRSKRKLMDALEELVHEKVYRDITITELCDRARLSRPAFYQNFGRIDDVMKRLLFERVKSTVENMNLGPRLSSEELAKDYFEIVRRNEELMEILIRNDLQGMIIEMCTLVFLDMPQSYGNLGDDVDYHTKRFYSAFVAAGASTILASWMVDKYEMDEDDIVSVIAMALEGRPFRKA